MKQRILLVITTVVTLCSLSGIQAQNLPHHMSITPDGRMLLTGTSPNNTYYDQSLVRPIYLTFSSPTFWNQLLANFSTKTYLPADLQIDGNFYDSVGVRFRGNTSFNTGTSQKKSFKISLDEWVPGQEYTKYNIFKLNNAAGDASMMREVFYTTMIKRHVPTAQSNFVKLYLNGANWGLYSNIQQLNKDFLEEWYLSNDGIWWRADKPPGSPGGPGGGWGDGTAAINYLGTDTATYKQYYTLKDVGNFPTPWDYLVRLAQKLNTTPLAALEDTLSNYMDIDRTLWFLASEIAWTDDDSYVYKGKMDYYIYYDENTGLMAPHEFDGNSSLRPNFATTWGVFHNSTNVNYPLMNKLFQVPSLRQRYLAHMRTIIAEQFDSSITNPIFNNFRALVDTIVQNDPKKLYTYTQYNNEITVLRNFINTRRNYLNSNTEIQQIAPNIAEAPYYFNGVQYQQPTDMQPVTVRATVTSTAGIDNVQLYFSNNIVGRFMKTQMFDDGLHDDSLAGDGIYGGTIPGYAAGTWVRYYIQAASANTAKSVRYLPAGAEHDVFIYTVAPQSVANAPVVINEIMASNSTTVTDNFGEYDDWIELYNKTTQPVELSGYYLTDNPVNLNKWEIPAGTILQPNDYLIIWADEDSSQGPYHANFKLSATAEMLYLLSPALEIVDSLSWGQQTTDMGYARVPNGTGNFVIQNPTFSANNDPTGIEDPVPAPVAMSIYPNPAYGQVQIQLSDPEQRDLEIFNTMGQSMAKYAYVPYFNLSTETWPAGIYYVRCGEMTKRLVVR
jgi:spore coat protein CotH